MLDISATAGLVFMGVLVSLLVTAIKTVFKKDGKDPIGTTGSLLIVATISLIGAATYVTLTHFGYWSAFWKIITIAGAFYAYILKNIIDAGKKEDAASEI
jgi:hypothetical protein